MPAQPLPARGAGEFVIRYQSNKHHLTATLFRRAATGALVELGTERVSYPLAQETIARTEGGPGPEELGWVDDPEELGAFGKRLKKFAKKVAKSKLGKLVKKAGGLATAFVPGGSALKAGLSAGKLAAGLAKRKKRRRPANPDIDAAEIESEELGATAKPKAAPKAKAKPKPKAAAKPKAKVALKAKPKPKPKPAAKPKAKVAPKVKPKPKPKAAAKPKAKVAPKVKPKPKAAAKPISAAERATKVAQQGGAAQTLLKAAARADTPAKAAQATKLAKLAEEIEQDAPELAAALAELPETDPEDRDLVDQRAVAAAQKLAETPPEERAEVAKTIEQRLDAYKVIAPDGSTVYVPLEEVGT